MWGIAIPSFASHDSEKSFIQANLPARRQVKVQTIFLFIKALFPNR